MPVCIILDPFAALCTQLKVSFCPPPPPPSLPPFVVFPGSSTFPPSSHLLTTAFLPAFAPSNHPADEDSHSAHPLLLEVFIRIASTLVWLSVPLERRNELTRRLYCSQRTFSDGRRDGKKQEVPEVRSTFSSFVLLRQQQSLSFACCCLSSATTSVSRRARPTSHTDESGSSIHSCQRVNTSQDIVARGNVARYPANSASRAGQFRAPAYSEDDDSA